MNIIPLLYDILDSPNDDNDVLPSSLATHFIDKSGNLAFFADSNSKADSNDDGAFAADDSLSFGLPSARLEELLQSYQHATGVKRLDFRIFAYQLQICKMEWKECSKQNRRCASVSDIQGLTEALSLSGLQYLLSTLADKNVMWSLLDTLYDSLDAQKASADTPNIHSVANSSTSTLFVHQMKIVRVYGTILSILPCMTINSEDSGVGRVNQTSHDDASDSRGASTSSYRQAMLKNINITELLNTLAFSRPQEPLVRRLWHMIRNDHSICSVFESMARMSGDEKQLYSVAAIVSAAANVGVAVPFLVDSVYFILLLFFR